MIRIVKDKLRLGDLEGNRFQIAIREIDFSQKEYIIQRITSLQRSGFINYFGLQRFGSRDTLTHHIGIKLLNSQWDEAIELLMCPQPDDRQDIIEAREAWSLEKDASKALSLLPKFCTAERCVMNFFKDNPKSNSYLSAISKIPRSMRTLYVHAYQVIKT